MSITTKRHKEVTKPSAAAAFYSTKGTREKQNCGFLGKKNKRTQSEFLWRLTANVRVKRERLELREKLNRGIKGEALHSQRNILLFPFAVSRPFIHWNICTSDRLQQEIHPLSKTLLWGKQLKSRNWGGKKELAWMWSKHVHYLFALHHWRLSCFSFTKGFSDDLMHFSHKTTRLQKGRRVNKTVTCFLIKWFGGVK